MSTSGSEIVDQEADSSANQGSETGRRPITALRTSTVALIGVVAAVGITVVAATLVLGGDQETKQASVPIRASGQVSKVVVENSGGSVRVVGDAAAGTGVTGKADLQWVGSGPAPARLEQSLADGVLTLRKVCDPNADCGLATIDIRVPPSAALRATTSDGGIEVTALDGGVDLSTSNSGISLKAMGSGDVVMRTSNAGIEAAFVGAPKSIKAFTSNGGVTIFTDGRTPYFDNVTDSNGRRDLENQSVRDAPNVIEVVTSNETVKIR